MKVWTQQYWLSVRRLFRLRVDLQEMDPNLINILMIAFSLSYFGDYASYFTCVMVWQSAILLGGVWNMRWFIVSKWFGFDSVRCHCGICILDASTSFRETRAWHSIFDFRFSPIVNGVASPSIEGPRFPLNVSMAENREVEKERSLPRMVGFVTQLSLVFHRNDMSDMIRYSHAAFRSSDWSSYHVPQSPNINTCQ